jgi:hypothetical protein
MRVNVYKEEMTDRVEIVEKGGFTGLRIYLYMPVTNVGFGVDGKEKIVQMQGPFIHHEGDDDSSAITFWGKADLRDVLKKALNLLDEHYEKRKQTIDGKHGLTE